MMKILSPKGALLSVTKVEPLVEKRVSFKSELKKESDINVDIIRVH